MASSDGRHVKRSGAAQGAPKDVKRGRGPGPVETGGIPLTSKMFTRLDPSQGAVDTWREWSYIMTTLGGNNSLVSEALIEIFKVSAVPMTKERAGQGGSSRD